MNVSIDSVKYMKKVIIDNNLRTVLEIGCFNGYSAMHFASVAEKVFSIEIYEAYAKMALENFKKFGVKNVEVVVGDALEVINDMDKKFDLIFIDGMKRQYKVYLLLALNLINKNGFIFVDNTISHINDMQDFLSYLDESDLDWKETGFGKGLIEIKF